MTFEGRRDFHYSKKKNQTTLTLHAVNIIGKNRN